MKKLSEIMEESEYSLDDTDWEIQSGVFGERIEHKEFALQIHIRPYYGDYVVNLYGGGGKLDTITLGTIEESVEHIMESLIPRTGLEFATNEQLRAEIENRDMDEEV